MLTEGLGEGLVSPLGLTCTLYIHCNCTSFFPVWQALFWALQTSLCMKMGSAVDGLASALPSLVSHWVLLVSLAYYPLLASDLPSV